MITTPDVSGEPGQAPPYRQTTLLDKLASEGVELSAHDFQAVVWHRKLRDDTAMCWRASEGGLVKWSTEMLPVLRRLTKRQLTEARDAYRQHMREVSKRRAP